MTVAASGAAAPVKLALDAANFKRVPHKNKYGQDYQSSETY